MIIASALLAALFAGTYVPNEGDIPVRVWQTTGEKSFREVPTTPFTHHFYTDRAPLDVDAAEERHMFSWLGVSMTDASAWILNELPAEKRAAILEAVFGKSGAQLGAIRLNIGASDYSTALYTYNDTPGDVEMKNFSVARDDRHLFPMVKEALKANPDLFLFASPWSPPGWMKDTGNFVIGNFKDGNENALANYFTAYVKACAKRGLDVKAVTVENESNLSTRGTYPSCVYTALQEANCAKAMRKAFDAAGLSTQIWIWDHNYDGATERVPLQLGEFGLKDVVQGVAWHSYWSEPQRMWPLKEAYPEISFYHTEMGPNIATDKRTERWWADKIFGAIENGCQSFTGWNLCLTPDGQPLTGPHPCGGLVNVDLDTGDFTFSTQYTVFRHIAPFVKKGAKVLKVDGMKDDCGTIFFRNPDGEHVMVVVSAGRGSAASDSGPRPRVYVKFRDEMKHLPLPVKTWSVTTMLFGR